VATAIDTTRGRAMASPPTKAARKAKGVDPKRCLEELDEIKAERDLHKVNWRPAFDFTQPDRKMFDGEQAGQPRQAPEIFDSYGQDACVRCVGNIVSTLVPVDGEWCEAAAGHMIPESKRQSYAKGLEEITKAVFDEIGSSNFAEESHSMGFDMVVASGFMAIDYGSARRPVVCQTIPMNEGFPDYYPHGELRAVYRDYECEVRSIRETWPTARLSASLERKAADTPRAKVRIIEADVHRENEGWSFAVIDPSDKSIIFERPATDPDEPCRWIVAGFYKRPKERYYYGVAQVALATLRTGNEIEGQDLKAGAANLAPATLIDTRTGLNPHTVRFGANRVGTFDGSQLNGDPPIHRFPPAGSPQWSEHKVDRYHALIDRVMFAEDDVPGTDESGTMTAYEVQARRQARLVRRGVNLGRFEKNFPFAVFRRVAWLLVNHGHIDVPGFKIDGRTFTIKARGPLARAREAEKSAATLGFVSQARAALGDQMTALGIKVEDVAATAAESSPDVPSSLVRDQQEREALQKSAAEAAAAQAGAGQNPQMAQSALPGAMQ